MGKSGKCMLRLLLLAAVLGPLRAQNDIEDFRKGVITGIAEANDMISSGSAAPSERSLKGDFFEVANAMKPVESRRKRRFIQVLGKEQLLVPVGGGAQPYLQRHLRRRKRAPCMGGGGASGGNYGEGGDAGGGAEEIARYMSQRRRKSAQQRKNTRSTNNGSNKIATRKRQIVSRRRRQAAEADASEGTELRRKAQEIAEKMQGVVKNVVGAMTDFGESMKQSFNQNAQNAG